MIKTYYKNGKPYKVDYKYKKRTPEEKRKLLEMRFWLKINVKGKEECWEWLGKTCDGSAIVYVNDKEIPTYRKGILARKFVWELHNNKETPKGMIIYNSCKNHLCCNPDHLFLRTKKVKTKVKEKKSRKKMYRIF